MAGTAGAAPSRPRPADHRTPDRRPRGTQSALPIAAIGPPATSGDHDMTHEHDTVVVSGGGNDTSMGVILGIIAVIVIVVAAWFFLLGPGNSGSSTTNNNTTTNN